MAERVVDVKLPEGGYRVCIGEGVLDRLGAIMRELQPAGKALLVSDTRVDALYGARCRCSLEAGGWTVSSALIRPGERSKSLGGAARLYDAAVEAGLDRRSPVIALGGGVAGDLAGFVAATYLRGVPLVMVPTTLLAQVDSSVGGKVAVNHRRGKNLIGAFHQPSLVAADPALLITLPRRQLGAGAAEAVKYGIIGDRGFFDWLEKNLERLWRRDGAALGETVERSVRTKAAVVEKDEREIDYRRILNFGHTFGHALEAATSYRYYLHGEAVLVGMAAATELARRMSLLESEDAARIRNLLGRVGLKKPPADITAEAVLQALFFDKKRRGRELVFVLPRAIGKVDFIANPDDKLLRQVTVLYLARRQPFFAPTGRDKEQLDEKGR